MKKQLFIISALLFSLFAFSQGIQFEHGTWKEVLQKAQQTNKPIFIDVYTSWCGPCRMMSQNVFPLVEVGKAYNANFICYQVDAEKGDGIEIAGKYEVKTFPTYLFLKADGERFYNALGAMETTNFIALSNKALTALNDSKPIDVWEKEYSTRKNDTTFMINYMKKRSDQGLSNSQQFEDYLKLLSERERTSPTSLDMYYTLCSKRNNILKINSLTYTNLQKNKGLFYNRWGSQAALDQLLFSYILNSLNEAGATKNKRLLDSVVTAYDSIPKKYLSPMTFLYRDELYTSYYAKTGEMKYYMEYATRFCNNYLMKVTNDTIVQKDKANFQIFKKGEKEYPANTDSSLLAQMRYYFANMERIRVCQSIMNVAWVVQQEISDKKTLQNALIWSKRSLEFMPENSGCLNVYANLLYKLGKQKLAIAKEEEALMSANKAENIFQMKRKGIEQTLTKMKAGEKTWKN